MSKRPPSTPPKIPGFSHIRHLGSGGFADVFLYEEQMLGRKVAVKVLLSDDLAERTLENFTNEANLMAQLANHPSIVSVYQARVSEEGRPFIVMEYCSRPNLQVRYRAARFSEAETLKIGVQIAGAIETAHRAGILHRDIKPANILVTDYGRPALTDFGISAATGSDGQSGMSVPWAPPESFASGARGDERSDLYSLGATLYTLLAGRTPFELPGGSNSSLDVMGRIQTATLPPIGRSDLSAAFEKVLAVSMAKDPAKRYQTAMEFARALQRVQIDLGIQPTLVDVVEESSELIDHDEEDGLTRIRGVVSIDAQNTERTTTRPGATVEAPMAVTPQTWRPSKTPSMLPPLAPPVEDTMLRAPAENQVSIDLADPDSEPAPKAATGRLVKTMALSAVALLAAGGLVATLVLVFGNQTPTAAQPEPTQTVLPMDPANPAKPVPSVAKVTAKVTGGKALFSWDHPDPKDGDTFLWRQVEPGVKHTYAAVPVAQVSLPMVKGGPTCIEVLLRRSNGQGSAEPMMGCAK